MSHYLNKAKVQSPPVAEGVGGLDRVQDRLARVIAKESGDAPKRILKPPIG